MTSSDPPETLSFTPPPLPAAIWQAEHDHHEEKIVRAVLYLFLAGVLLWLVIEALVSRC
jgi:hypothetical protein